MSRAKRVDAAVYDRACQDRAVAELALHLVMTETVAATERYQTQDGGRYKVELYGPARADGGLVIVRFRCAGQKDAIRAYRLDDAYRHAQENLGGSDDARLWCVALERLTLVRNAVVNGRPAGLLRAAAV